MKVLNATTDKAIAMNAYARDVDAIRAICDEKQSVLPNGTFVLTTIQAGLSTCKGQIKDVNKLGSASRFMWGQKGKGLDYMKQHDGFLFGKIKYIEQKYGLDSIDGCVEAIELFLNVPNLGMVKAAFVAQMFGFNVACIDSHNLTRLGLNANAVKLGKVKPATRRAKIADYVKMTQIQGSAFWWNSWCDYVAGNRANKELTDGNIVSRYHVECVDAVEV